MTTRTEFGDYLLELRRNNNEILYDMAKKLNVGCAYLSGIENGKEPITEGLVDNIIKTYNLDIYNRIKILSSANMSNMRNGYQKIVEIYIGENNEISK